MPGGHGATERLPRVGRVSYHRGMSPKSNSAKSGKCGSTSTDLSYSVWPTAWGPMGAVRSPQGLCRLELPHYSKEDLRALLQWEHPGVRADDAAGAEVAELCRAYFNAQPVDFSAVACDLSAIGPFGQTILNTCRQIAHGQTRSYTQLALMAGQPETKARPAAQALAKNPVPLVIPCHRVLAAGGGLNGFSAPGGIELKRRLLELERK
jgi:methylated-DNA-[protein]-cysteine S-methyltransferase